MSGPRTKKTRPPHPPRDVLKKISGAEVLEAGGSILSQFVALVFEGFRQASSHVKAALPAHTSEAEADAVDAALALCFGATVRLLLADCGGQACASDPSDAGKLLRLVMLGAIMNAAGHTGEIKETVPCQPQNRPN